MIKVAIPLLENKGKDSPISEHFGHAPFFGFVYLEGSEYKVDIHDNPFNEHTPGQIPQYMKQNGVNVMVARGIGSRAIEFFADLGIEVYKGADGTVQQIMDQFIQSTLKDKDYKCNHSEDEHHDCHNK
ncbi:MAG TPA: NifB/NifX family molybdenum-iron cluster-binding protein [Petrotogaceae bacterium]|jgi:predicted Fe-Mo cluster-binding NifX family protein|nr:NifB/NifX family molybdenum-iron cluster-binding protein [Petrotogaceae bacterium]HOG34228.1 NifB/NifX family molybdenum-iron cluster-binding protein [Petrotogaceae bacterium]HPA92966.1 NifB/NifX family molybdenum-iron cluster-binding protein [Petrotogaceae bacterium]HQO11747.1 NifB/NifX family molybdenum-iron cluster-binding protein [Petrotogaceae bacterium]HQP57423.1 NifB/NifX family molybdenum-iron cluster-binding protein [Petrotogaceae bacterium]